MIKQEQVSFHNKYKRLSSVRSSKDIQFSSYAIKNGNHCPLDEVLELSYDVKNLSTLIVGMTECAFYSKMIFTKSYGRDGQLHWTYSLEESDIIFGFKKSLKNALNKMVNEGAKTILLCVTCIPQLISDDVQMDLDEIRETINADIIYLPLAHYMCNGSSIGVSSFFEGFVEIMREKKQEEQVNFLCYSQSNYINYFSRIINEKNYNVNLISANSKIEDYKKAPKAKINIVFSAAMIKLAEKMKSEFNIPYITLFDVYSPEQIEKSNKLISEMLNIDIKFFLDEKKQEVIDLQDKAQKILKEKSFILTQSYVHTLSLVEYLSCLGAEPLLLNIEEFSKEELKYSKNIKNNGFDPYVCSIINGDINFMEGLELSPQFIVGEYIEGLKQENLNLIDFSSLSGKYGYERTAELLKIIIDKSKEFI